MVVALVALVLVVVVVVLVVVVVVVAVVVVAVAAAVVVLVAGQGLSYCRLLHPEPARARLWASPCYSGAPGSVDLNGRI